MRKNLLLIGGTMGVGKSLISETLNEKLPMSVLLDGDWRWKMSPFIVNDENKEMVNNNIVYLLNNFLHNSSIENIVFCWVMHLEAIINDLTERLDLHDCDVYKLTLMCSEKTLEERLLKDIGNNIRDPEIIDRSKNYLSMYHELDTLKIHTDGKTPETIVDTIISMLEVNQ